MAYKFVALACLVAAAHAGVIAPVAHYSAAPAYTSYAAPAVAKVVAPVAAYAPAIAKVAYRPAAQYEHYEDGPAEYNFEYSVHDEHTGDIKSQQEVRHGDQVQGSYSLIEADGTRRIVDYTADDHNGFNAVVRREPAQHGYKQVVTAAPVAYKQVVAAPVAYKQVVAAPVAKVLAAPVAYKPAYASYAAPANSYYH